MTAIDNAKNSSSIIIVTSLYRRDDVLYKTEQKVLLKDLGNTHSGYDFNGWSDGTNTYSASATYTVEGDVKLTGAWTKKPAMITFNGNGHGSVLSPVQVNQYNRLPDYNWAQKVTADPGYTFDGWYYDAQKGRAWQPPNTFYEDTTLYAGWR